MKFIGTLREFSLKNEEQYNTIGDFWDELSLIYGMENLQGLGYKWENNTIYYAIGLKKGIIENSNFTVELPDYGWTEVNGETYNLKEIQLLHFHILRYYLHKDLLHYLIIHKH